MRTLGHRLADIVGTWRMITTLHSQHLVAAMSCCHHRHRLTPGPWFVQRFCQRGSTRPCCGGLTPASTTRPTWRLGYSRGARLAGILLSAMRPRLDWSCKDHTVCWRSLKAASAKIRSFDSHRHMPHGCTLSRILQGIISRVCRSAILIYCTNNNCISKLTIEVWGIIVP